MPIASSDIEFRLSGGAANTSPAASLGGAMSTAGGGLITSAALNNLWDDVSGGEAAAGDIEYRGIYVKNNHGSLTLLAAVLWIASLTSSADTEFDIALSAAAVNAAMGTIANESTEPAIPGEISGWSRPTSKAAGLVIGDIPAGQFKGIWLRRTVDAAADAANDTGTIRVEGDTNP